MLMVLMMQIKESRLSMTNKIFMVVCFLTWLISPLADQQQSLADEQTSRPNVLLICIDDLRPELNCYGAEYIHSPHIDRIAQNGVRFTRHYVQAPTCGASRYTLLTGMYGPADNMALFARAKKIASSSEQVTPSMPAWFQQNGYTTVSVGKVSHHPGGRGGKDWNDESIPEMPHSWTRHLMPVGPWQHPRGAMHGLANGEIRGDASKMDVFQSTEGPATTYPDGLIVNESLSQLQHLANGEKPFFLAVGLIRPHLPFGAPADYYDAYEKAELPETPHPQKPAGKTTWHGSGEFMKYNRWNRDPREDKQFATQLRRHYAACVSYADAQVGRLMAKLTELELEDDTIVVVWGDHGWHLGEHAIWGKHALFEESLLSPLLVKAPGVPQGQVCSQVVETLDLFPTLCELTGVKRPEFLVGQSLEACWNDSHQWSTKPAFAYTRKAKTLRTESHRLIVHHSGQVELYDHQTAEAETENQAPQHPELVRQLQQQLIDRLK